MNRPLTMTAEQIKYMRDRFLNWTLPKDLNPDGGISFKRSESAIKYNHPMPVGTNFLDAAQAEEMVRYMIDGLPELDATRAALDASERFKNPWTVEVLNQRSGHWVDFCLDAPLLLADAEERERMLQAEQPKAKFRIVPWLNSDQRQFVQKQNDASEQTIRELRAVANKLAEALKDVDSAMTSGPMALNEARKILRAALAQYAEMKSDKLASSKDPGSDTGALQGGRE